MRDMRHRRPGELGFTLLLVLGSAFMLWQAYGISKFESITSAGVFPMVATGVMLLTALRALLGALRAAPAVAGHESTAARFFSELTPPVLIGFTAAIVAYMVALEPLGFIVASYLFLLGSMFLLGSRRWGMNLVVSALSLAAIVFVFQTAFSVMLPKGTLIQGWLS